MQFSELPQELVTEILSRLPVKSLVRFRCVSKSWLSLIYSPDFIKAHLKKSSTNNEYAHHGLIFIDSLPDAVVKQCSLANVLNTDATEATEVDYPSSSNVDPLNYVYSKVKVVGSCNGLFCIDTWGKDLFLWNPTIRKSKKLPDFEIEWKFYHISAYGFGYDESTDDYKVVRIFCLYGGPDGPPESQHKSQVLVYSLKADSWMAIENLKGGAPYSSELGKFASGKLHWKVMCPSGSRYWEKIVSLDLQSLTYGEVEEAEYSEGLTHSSLHVLAGCLATVCLYQNTQVDIWMLKEYGVRESWTKVVLIPDFRDISFIPVCLLNNGEFLLTFWPDLVVYCPKGNSMKTRRIGNLEGYFDLTAYVESLVPPTASDRAEHQHGQ